MNLHFVFIQYEMGECVRAGFCNFMHLKPISRDLRRELYSRGARFRSRSRTPLRDRDRNGSSGGRSKRRSSRSPKRRKHWNWNYNKCCQTASFAVMLNIESVSCVEKECNVWDLQFNQKNYDQVKSLKNKGLKLPKESYQKRAMWKLIAMTENLRSF